MLNLIHFGWMIHRSPFPPFFSKAFSSFDGKLSSPSLEHKWLVMQCQLCQSSVMPRWALDQVWVIERLSVLTFLWWQVIIFFVSWAKGMLGEREVSVSGRHSVRSSLSPRDRNWSRQLPKSECPNTQEMAKRLTHCCLLPLPWLTDSPPSESHRRASPLSVSQQKWY